MRLINSKLRIVLLALLLVFSFVEITTYQPRVEDVKAETEQEKLEKLNEEIEKYEAEITRLREQANTLNNQIAQYDAQINLTNLKISQTEDKIAQLGGRIDELEVSLNSLKVAFEERVAKAYKLSRLNQTYMILVGADSLSEAVNSFHYLGRIQEADRDLLVRLEDAQTSYIHEKDEHEELQIELEDQKSVLGTQKSAKTQLLSVTKNDEKKFQQLLSTAKAELEAIQSIIAGRGEETEVGSVGVGQRIASVIPGASACSSGGHLHLEVVKDGVHLNPATFLTGRGVVWDNAPDGEFGFGGGWPWPLNDPIRITQGYGMTYYAAQLRYYGGAPHTGIDMVNNADYTVKAVSDGTLFQGSIKCGGGLLKYVHLKHGDGYETYYLHVNY